MSDEEKALAEQNEKAWLARRMMERQAKQLGWARGRLERDRLWCAALLEEGTDVIERVTRRFNESRPDKESE